MKNKRMFNEDVCPFIQKINKLWKYQVVSVFGMWVRFSKELRVFTGYIQYYLKPTQGLGHQWDLLSNLSLKGPRLFGVWNTPVGIVLLTTTSSKAESVCLTSRLSQNRWPLFKCITAGKRLPGTSQRLPFLPEKCTSRTSMNDAMGDRSETW